MTGPIATARAWLTDQLTALTSAAEGLNGWTVHPCMPETINAPCLVIAEADPLVTSTDQPMGSVGVNLEIAVIARGQANPDTFPLLDAATDDLLEGLHDLLPEAATYSVVTTPDQLKYLGTRLTVTVPIHL